MYEVGGLSMGKTYKQSYKFPHEPISMSKAPFFVIIGSGIAIAISLLMIGFGGVAIVDIDVEGNAIFQGSSGSVPVEKSGIYTIFVNDQYRCDETTISITDGTTEFFISECDRTFDEVGWRAIGVMEPNLNGELSVSANHEIIIVDDIVYISEGGGLMLGGGGLCCIGIIGLVIGIVMAFNKKGKGGVQHVIIQQPMMQQQHQQPVQQPSYDQTQYFQNPTGAEAWDQSGMANPQFPPATMSGMSDPSGTEWLDYEGRKYYRVSGINTNWNLYKQ